MIKNNDDEIATYEEIYDDAYKEYLEGEYTPQLEVAIDQDFVDAKNISFFYHPEEMIEFPWHKHSKEDFIALHEKMTRIRPILKYVTNRRIKSIFRIVFKEIYYAYFNMPVEVELINGELVLTDDGRHRVKVAKDLNGQIPVLIIKQIDVNKISKEEYLRTHSYIGWKFFEGDH